MHIVFINILFDFFYFNLIDVGEERHNITLKCKSNIFNRSSRWLHKGVTWCMVILPLKSQLKDQTSRSPKLSRAGCNRLHTVRPQRSQSQFSKNLIRRRKSNLKIRAANSLSPRSPRTLSEEEIGCSLNQSEDFHRWPKTQSITNAGCWMMTRITARHRQPVMRWMTAALTLIQLFSTGHSTASLRWEIPSPKSFRAIHTAGHR